MQRLNLVVGLSGLMLIGSYGAAGTTVPTASARRQLNDCMMKRMAASKTLSYNEATKVCKELLAAQSVAPPPQTHPNIGGSTVANSPRS